jgi:hypothetical protein
MNLLPLQDTASQGVYGFLRSLKEYGIRDIMNMADGCQGSISLLKENRVTGWKNGIIIDNLI